MSDRIVCCFFCRKQMSSWLELEDGRYVCNDDACRSMVKNEVGVVEVYDPKEDLIP